MHYLGTYILHSFSLLKELKPIILFSHFYLFQNGLIDLLTPKSSHILSKNMLFCIEG